MPKSKFVLLRSSHNFYKLVVKKTNVLLAERMLLSERDAILWAKAWLSSWPSHNDLEYLDKTKDNRVIFPKVVISVKEVDIVPALPEEIKIR